MVTECELDLWTVLFVLIYYYSVLLFTITVSYYLLLQCPVIACSTFTSLFGICPFYCVHFVGVSYLVITCNTLHISSHKWMQVLFVIYIYNHVY